MNTKQAIDEILEAFGIVRKRHPWEGAEIPLGYNLNENGVYRLDPPAEEGGDPVDVFLSAPVWVDALVIDSLGQWSRLVRFLDHNKKIREIVLSDELLHGRGHSAVGRLAGAGLLIRQGRGGKVVDYLLRMNPPNRVIEEAEKTEDEQIIGNIREFILKNEDRFQDGDPRPVRSRAGYRYRSEGWWGFTRSALIEAAGCSPVKAARALVVAGYLVKNDASNMMKCPIQGGVRSRLYVVSDSVLEYEGVTLSAHVPHPPPMGESQTWAAETRATSGLAHVAHVGEDTSQVGQENPTNLLVTTIDDGDNIDSGYQPSIHEMDAVASLMNPPQPLEIEASEHEQYDDEILSHAYAAFAAEHGIEVRH